MPSTEQRFVKLELKLHYCFECPHRDKATYLIPDVIDLCDLASKLIMEMDFNTNDRDFPCWCPLLPENKEKKMERKEAR